MNRWGPFLWNSHNEHLKMLCDRVLLCSRRYRFSKAPCFPSIKDIASQIFGSMKWQFCRKVAICYKWRERSVGTFGKVHLISAKANSSNYCNLSCTKPFQWIYSWLTNPRFSCGILNAMLIWNRWLRTGHYWQHSSPWSHPIWRGLPFCSNLLYYYKFRRPDLLQ